MSAKDKAGGKTKKRAQRATSNVFAMFEQSQIQEFKEAFTMIDQDRDGFIGKEDLTDTFASLGRAPKDAEIEAMLSEAPGPINFTMFLTLFGDKISGTDPEEVIKSAFKMFDVENTGKIGDDVLRDILMNMGERFTKEEVDQAYNGAPITKGMVDYVQFARIMTRGTDDEPPK